MPFQPRPTSVKVGLQGENTWQTLCLRVMTTPGMPVVFLFVLDKIQAELGEQHVEM
jgi:hypothetical protein